MKATLTVHGKELNGRTFTFTEQGSFLFGSAADVTCRITGDPYVSRHHFYLLVGFTDVRLRDLQSTNGTEVDGKLYRGGVNHSEAPPLDTLVKGEDPPPGEDVLLHDGSEIEVGYTKMSVAIKVDAECGSCGSVIPDDQKASTKSGDAFICQKCRQQHASELQRIEKLVRLVEEGNALLKQHKGREALAKFQDAEKLDPKHPDVQAGLAQARELIATPPAAAGGGVRQTPAARPLGQSDILLRALLARLNMREPAGPIPTISGYGIVKLLAKGGQGAVFEGMRISKGTKVAIKVVLPDRKLSPDAIRRFKREIALTRELCSTVPLHPNIIEFIEGGDANGLLWMALEFVENGWDVERERCKCGGRIPRNEALTYILQVLNGLAHAHSKGIVHRDLKPPNILLVRGNIKYTAKLTDFGLAKSLENAQLNLSIVTKPGMSMGTLPYMPPEQVIDVTTATYPADVFSMGATLYHMLTGQFNRNYAHNQNRMIRQVVEEPIISIQQRDRTVPAQLAMVINKSQELKPENRYSDGATMRSALIEAAKQSGIPI